MQRALLLSGNFLFSFRWGLNQFKVCQSTKQSHMLRALWNTMLQVHEYTCAHKCAHARCCFLQISVHCLHVSVNLRAVSRCWHNPAAVNPLTLSGQSVETDRDSPKCHFTLASKRLPHSLRQLAVIFHYWPQWLLYSKTPGEDLLVPSFNQHETKHFLTISSDSRWENKMATLTHSVSRILS